MKHTVTKVIAICLSAALAAGGIGLASRRTEPAGGDSAPAEIAAPLAARTAAAGEGVEVSKDETVYILAGADGAVERVIVSDWLKNTDGARTIRDQTELSDIENVKGDETYTSGGAGTILWDAQGNDIFYQGDADRDPPVDIAVTYTLDGKQVTPGELAGRSGKVTIRFDYTNQQYGYAEIDGRQEKLYVPFAVLTGMVLDNEVFSNTAVTNGRLVNDGERTVVVGMAFPGLQEDLAISGDTLEIPDYVEITADVKNFALDMTVTLAVNEPFSKLNTDRLDSFDNLGGSMDGLTDAMDQLLDGSSQLSDGLNTLLDQSGALVDGMDALQSGAAQLSGGLNTLTANNDSLNGGARQVFETLLATADTQLAAAGLDLPALTVDNYAAVLDKVIASIDEMAQEQALTAVTAAVEEQRAYIEEQVTAAVREQVAEQVIAAAVQMDKASYDAAVAAGMVDQATQSAVETAIDQQMESGEVKAAIATNTDAQVQKAITDNMASDEVQTKLAEASESAKAVISLKASLDSYNTFYQGLQSYTAGVSQAAAGAGELKDGTDELKAAAPALIDGISRLRDGAAQLSDGLEEFSEEGIQKLVDAFDGELDGLAARIRAVKEVSEQFTSFAGTGGTDSQVQFIYRTGSVG